jgi:geranylgeranyl diphosphate synthase type II
MSAVWQSPPGRTCHTPPIVPELLHEYGDATRRALASYVADDRPAPHLQALIAGHFDRNGKMMRPSICIAVARAFGASSESAVLCAAAIEILHNAVLIHDDIEDASETRRGLPTLHATHGIPLALNAGDAMLLMALRPLSDSLRCLSPSAARAIIEQTQIMARETVEGQALELGWRDTNVTDIAEADYLAMVMKKTAWLAVIWPAQVGAIIGTRGATDPERFVRFGFFLGAAFQIQDDLLNLVADRNYGKERLGDLYEGKRTIMLVHARRTCSRAERRDVDAILALDRRRRTPAMVSRLYELIERQGSIPYAHAFASALAGAAQREFEQAFGALPASRDKAFLEGLPTWVFERT